MCIYFYHSKFFSKFCVSLFALPRIVLLELLAAFGVFTFNYIDPVLQCLLVCSCFLFLFVCWVSFWCMFCLWTHTVSHLYIITFVDRVGINSPFNMEINFRKYIYISSFQQLPVLLSGHCKINGLHGICI